MKTLQKYIDGKLSEEELEQFSEQLIQAKLDHDKKRRWAQLLEAEHGVAKKPSRKSIWNRKTGLFGLLLAASLAIVVAFFSLSQADPADAYIALADQQISRLSIMGDPAFFRKGQHEVDSLRKEANLAYVGKKYEASIRLWEQVILAGKARPEDHFYLALCQLQKAPSEPRLAIASLGEARASQGLQEEISWVMALAYLKAGELELARGQLRRIVEEQAYMAAEAEGLLLELN